MAELSIWSWVIADDLDAMFAALVRAPRENFEAAAEPFLSRFPMPDLPEPEETLARTIKSFEALDLPEETKRQMIDGLREAFEDDAEDFDGDDEDENDQFDEEDDDDPTFPMASRREIPLATSHMFFDDPYASLEYEEIDRQVSDCLLRYRAAVSRALGGSGESFASYIGATEVMLNDDANYDLFERFCADGFDWVWPSQEAVFFLVHDHEDKELPIYLSFGCASQEDFAGLRAHIRATD